MNREDLIKKIYNYGNIGKKIHYEIQNNLIGVSCSKSFLITLQEIDSSVFKYYPPMDVDEIVPLEKITLLFNYEDCRDYNEKSSIFLATNPNNLVLAKNHTLRKIDIFFKKPRFINNSFDLELKNFTKGFIEEFFKYKINLLIKNFNK
tara:strand:- start:8 stop:451 length:444 start_codon:yes stop_codon:yes gene_type:complete